MSAVAEIKEEQAQPGAPAPHVSLVEVKPQTAPQKRARRSGRMLLMLALPAALVAGGAWFWVTGGRFQETENANVQQAKVTIASEIAGRITEVRVADNASVKAGDVLFVVEPEPYRIALAQADAALEAARLNVEQLRAAYSQATTQLHAQEGEVAYLKASFDRQSELAGKGFSAKASLDESRQEWQRAEDKRLAAAETVASTRAALGGDPNIEADRHPTVLAALAARDKAAYALSQTTVRAPADGIVSQASSFRVGQFVGAGTAAFSLVETGDTWIAANFKETQLTNMRAGQDAEIVLDTYPDRVFHARIEAIGAGTGAGIVLLASLALLPPMLARLFNHPTITTGIVMAPRGVGTMISMILVGRLVRMVDARYLVVTGLLLTAFSLYEMTGFSPQMDDFMIVTTGIVQGLGLGLVFVPLSTVTFATLDARYRTDAAALFSLVRNIGSSIGISIVTVLLTRNMQINHAELSAAVNPFNQNLAVLSPAAAAGNPAALSQVDKLVNQQALMISYITDFKLMMIVTLCAIPLALLLRKPPAAVPHAAAAAME